MLIKFKDSDPRAGQVVRMDSHRGQELVDSGSAVKVKDGGAEDAVVAPHSPAVTRDVAQPDDSAAPSVTVAAPKPARVKK